MPMTPLDTWHTQPHPIPTAVSALSAWWCLAPHHKSKGGAHPPLSSHGSTMKLRGRGHCQSMCIVVTLALCVQKANTCDAMCKGPPVQGNRMPGSSCCCVVPACSAHHPARKYTHASKLPLLECTNTQHTPVTNCAQIKADTE